ncbi:unnamed protein product [Rotaria magnacalcarata]|uniref:Uncharacterized protein n=1 Tax=Rotaria magnacalcarata TaxID=392030 RepID=A0A816LXQ1_9BILA|nr:unnamed protein product [Rotaria magnacalcarata]
MGFTQRILNIISILIIMESYLCQDESYSIIVNDDINAINELPINRTLTVDDTRIEDTFNSNSSTQETIIENSSTINTRKKYVTDEENYTSVESITFSIRTNQQTSKAITVLIGFAYENISYAFHIEKGKLNIIFSQGELSYVTLTTKNDTELITDGQWHPLNVERSNLKLKFTLDNIEQSNVELPDGWLAKRNVFIGAELITVPDGNFSGNIRDISITNAGRPLNLRIEDNSDERLEQSQTTTTTAISSVVNQSESLRTIGFHPNDNNPIIFPSPIKAFFKTLSFSFRAYSNLSTIIRFDEISLNIDVDGYLTLFIQDRQVQRIFSYEERKPINDGKFYFVELQLNDQTLEAWIDKNKKISIELSSSFLFIEKFLFGLNNRFIGCIENVTYNNEILILEGLSSNRQQCFSNNIIIKSIGDSSHIDRIISFKENDRPLIVILDNPEEFHMFSLLFYTQEANSIIGSLADETYENFMILTVKNEYLYLTYYNKGEKIIEITTNSSVNDNNEHKIVIKLIHQTDLLFELDGNIIMENMTEMFYISTVYIGKLDSYVKEQFSNVDGAHFIGCIENVMLNKQSIVKLEHVNQLDRLINTCRIIERKRTKIISYISPDVSFSVRDPQDIIEIQISPNEEFYHCQISFRTPSSNGIIASIYSNVDHRDLILFLKDGKFHLTYDSTDNESSQLIFRDNETTNDGQQHYILISHQISTKNLSIQIDNRSIIISNLSSLSLFFDVITIGGSYRVMSINQFVGCFANITYNHRPLLLEDMVKSDRYDCIYEQDSICDRQVPCINIQPLQFCGQPDCSLVCTSSSLINADDNKGSLQYSAHIESGVYEQIHLMIFTISANAILFSSTNGTIQVSIIIQNYYPRLIIRTGGIIYTYDFPGRVRGDKWHVLQCQKTINTIDLTFDDETRHYTYLIEYFSLFGDKKIYLCGKNFIGYVQDIIFMADNHHENLIHNSIRNPELIDYDYSVTWNNRADVPERTPCEQLRCLNGGYCIQPATKTTLAYCNCPSQYSGYRCEQPVDPCLSYQCHHGTCQKDRSNQPYCACNDGYVGSRCENQIDPCSKATCNFGRCKAERSVVICICNQGYTGRNCLTPIDACTRVSCNYGRCVNEGASYRCQCDPGYEGSVCDRQIDLCASFTCYNGGRCHLDGHRPLCQCNPGYEGSACDRQIDPCASFTCYNGGRCLLHEQQPTCECTLGYRGSDCYEIEVVDPCLRFDCYGGSCMNDRGTARCICPTGRSGSRCQDDICTLYPCANNGQCVPESGTRRCICQAPYHGDDCRDYTAPDPCSNIYCGSGECRNGICECYGGYTGSQCEIPPNLCADVNCNYGSCEDGVCSCPKDYTGTFCETPITTPPPGPLVVTTIRVPLTPIVAITGPKNAALVDYGRSLSSRAGPIGWILALIAGLLLIGIALAFLARNCVPKPIPPVPRPVSVVIPGTSNATQTETQNLLRASDTLETTRIEETREIVREYGVMDNATGLFTSYPTMSSRHGDFARDNQQQQTSTDYTQQRFIETDYHPPPVADFGYVIGEVVDGYRDTYETWDGACGGACGYSMNAMDGCFQTDYEFSNINSISMTPNGKYAIVGQSQGPPQIWNAVNGQLVSSMQGTCANCIKVELACNGTLLVGLAGDGIDIQTRILQMWDVNTGKSVQLTHQIKCATFVLSNNSSNLIMAGNQKFGRGISVGVLDLSNSELTKEIKSDTNQCYGGTPSFIGLTPDERYAIVGCPTGSASTNYVVFDLTTPHELVQPLTVTIDADPKCILVLNNDQILTGTRNGQVIVWDVVSCQQIQTLSDNGQIAHRDRITDIKLSPDRSYFVTASADGIAKVWNANTKELISRLVGHSREITCICVSTNQLVGTGSRDETICLWRMQTGQIASNMPVNMTPLDIHMAAHNRTIVAIGEKDNERQLLMLRIASLPR